MRVQTSVSCPGKLLVTGGYTILSPEHEGLVLATSSRFYCTANSVESHSISVTSPQFTNAKWDYTLSGEPVVGKNGYIETTLRYTMAYISAAKSTSGVEIVVKAHNDFYSQRENLQKAGLPLTTHALKSIPQFSKLNCTIENVHKTGLGSSAALITSLVATLLLHYEMVELDADGLRIIHNLSQLCHCKAQGKVGSGFDVSSACFGSHVYKRFRPDILSDVMNGDKIDVSQIQNLVSNSEIWDGSVSPISLPPGLHVRLADIDAGSSTPKLVSGVLKWRSQDPESDKIWQSLVSENNSFVSLLRKLSSLSSTNIYESALKLCSEKPATDWNSLEYPEYQEVINTLYSLYSTFSSIRSTFRLISERANVPIEPSEQTELLDRCMSVPGVILAGVPGAGGYDAIMVISVGHEALDRVENEIWGRYVNVGPLLAVEGSGGVKME